MGTRHSVIDIAKDAKNDVPTTYDWNTISLTRRDEPVIKTKDGGDEKPLENYKIYKHELPDNDGWSSTTYELKAVNYKDKQQYGLDTRSGFKTHRTLEVVYWLRDDHNSFPLIIGLGTTNLNYYRRKNETINRWEESGIIYPATISEYNKLLCKLNNELKSIVIIQLQAGASKSYCGHPSVKQGDSPPEDCEEKTDFPTVSVTCSNDSKGFDKYTHTCGRGSPMKILSALHSGNRYSFNLKDIDTQYKEVHVYYSSTDHDRNKPLIIELVNFNTGKSEYYTFENKFNRANGITKTNIIDHLDTLNCRQNNIAVADVSQKSGYYCKCKSGKHKEIQVTPDSNNVPEGYTSYIHLPADASFNLYRFKDETRKRTFSPIPDKFIGCYVYFCDKNKNMPLLVYMDKGSEHGGIWLKRTSGGFTTLTDTNLSSLKSHTPSSSSIKQHVEDTLRSICKDLQISGCLHANTPTIATTPAPTFPLSSQDGGSSGGPGGAERSNLSDRSSSSSSLPSSSQLGDTGPQGPPAKPEQDGKGEHTVGGASDTEAETEANGLPDGAGGSAGEGSSSSSGSSISRSDGNLSGDHGGVTPDAKQNPGGFIQKATEFITSTKGIVATSVTSGVLTFGTGGITYSCLKRRRL